MKKYKRGINQYKRRKEKLIVKSNHNMNQKLYTLDSCYNQTIINNKNERVKSAKI